MQGHRLDINEEPAEQLGGRRRYNEDEGAGCQDNQVIRDQRAEEGEGHEDVRKYEAGTKQTDILQAETEGVKDYEKQIAIVTSYTASCLTLSDLVCPRVVFLFRFGSASFRSLPSGVSAAFPSSVWNSHRVQRPVGLVSVTAGIRCDCRRYSHPQLLSS